jgi:glycosyltransferase involved in cell wall biosynthesis
VGCVPSRGTLVHVMGWSSQQYGSFERFLVELARQCRSADLRTHLVFRNTPPSQEFLNDVPAEIHVVRELSPKSFASFATALSALLKRTSATHLHAHFGADAYGALALARLRGVERRFYTKHNTPRGRRSAGSRLRHRWLAAQTERVFAVSERVAEELEKLGVPRSKLEVCYLGVEPSAYRPDHAVRLATRRDLNVSDDRKVILSTSHLRPGKGVEALPVLAAALMGDPGGTTVVAAGDGELRSKLEADAARLGLDSETFRLLGVREDIPRLLAAADLFVLPTSNSEGMTLGTVEAMASGVPIVATAVSDLPELMGDYARLVSPGDVPGLIAACRATLTDPQAGSKAEAGRARVVERLDVRQAAETHVRRYLSEPTR